MAGGIKLFQFLRKFYNTFGFHPPLSPNQKLPFNAKNLFLLVSLIIFLLASIAFFLFAVTSINERADCLYICSACVVDIIHVLMHIRRIGQILQLYDNYEKFIEKSEKKSYEMLCKLKTDFVWTSRIALSSRIFRNEWKNWANDEIGLFSNDQNNIPGNTTTCYYCNRLQPVFWHGRRLIFVTILCIVRTLISFGGTFFIKKNYNINSLNFFRKTAL